MTRVTCASTGDQCDGQGFSPLGCCDAESQCEAVNVYFSKCVDQPACVDDDATCVGTGDHVMKQTPCCTSGHVCASWGDTWSVCRDPQYATCSKHGEQCAGTGGSSMKSRPCCEATDACVKVNEYYSKCDNSTEPAVAEATDHCPGLSHCPIR